MAQILINVGTSPNDGTGDTIRGAFINVNTNFSEVYNNIAGLAANVAAIDVNQNNTIEISFDTANAAFDKANAANVLAYDTGVSANLYSAAIGAAGNAYAVTVGASSNAYANYVSGAANAYAVVVGTSANSYATSVGAASNAWANTYASSIATSGNTWAITTFSTLSNVAQIYDATNAAFTLANTAIQNNYVQNSTVTLLGSLKVTASLIDNLGPIREKITQVANSDVNVVSSDYILIANNSNTISVRVQNDGNFIYPANTGTIVEIFQYGSGETTITPADINVTVNSSNGWSNIAGQYLSARLVKIASNTWMLTGNLKV